MRRVCFTGPTVDVGATVYVESSTDGTDAIEDEDGFSVASRADLLQERSMDPSRA